MKLRVAIAIQLGALATGAHAIYGHNQLDGSVFDWVGNSGTVISPHFVVTAGHVGGMNFSLNGTNYTAAERFDHPTADISLLRFDAPFAKYSLPYFGSVLGEVVTFVGFGFWGTERTTGPNAWTGYNIVGGEGRAAVTNRIELVEFNVDIGGSPTDVLVADLDYYDSRTPLENQVDTLGGGGAVENEGGIIFGDSGSAALLKVNGEWRSVGVNIGVDTVVGPDLAGSEFSDYGDIFAATSIGAYQDWILSIAPEANPVPEPATIAALGLGSLIIARRKRSQK